MATGTGQFPFARRLFLLATIELLSFATRLRVFLPATRKI
jgi:hypothetical protein